MITADLGLDDLLPEWDRRERHQLTAWLPAADILHAAEALTWAEVPAFHAMVRAVGLGRTPYPADGRVLDMFLGHGFAVLARTDHELVIGGIEAISRRQPIVALEAAHAAEVFGGFAQPGHLKIAFNFRHVNGQLSTETRVLATSATARRLFAAYWFLIRGGSGAIRHLWLRGIRQRAATRPDITPPPRTAVDRPCVRRPSVPHTAGLSRNLRPRSKE